MSEFEIVPVVIGVILFFIALLAIPYIDAQNSKDRIRKYLQEKGASVIDIVWEWFDWDRDASTFSVTFEMPDGKTYQTVCKVRNGWTSDGLFWSELIPDFDNEPQTQEVFAQQSVDQYETIDATDFKTTDEDIASEAKMLELIKKQNNLIKQLRKQNQELKTKLESPKATKSIY